MGPKDFCIIWDGAEVRVVARDPDKVASFVSKTDNTFYWARTLFEAHMAIRGKEPCNLLVYLGKRDCERSMINWHLEWIEVLLMGQVLWWNLFRWYLIPRSRSRVSEFRLFEGSSPPK